MTSIEVAIEDIRSISPDKWTKVFAEVVYPHDNWFEVPTTDRLDIVLKKLGVEVEPPEDAPKLLEDKFHLDKLFALSTDQIGWFRELQETPVD